MDAPYTANICTITCSTLLWSPNTLQRECTLNIKTISSKSTECWLVVVAPGGGGHSESLRVIPVVKLQLVSFLSTQSASYCSFLSTQSASYCSFLSTQSASYCSFLSEQSASYCSFLSTQSASYCSFLSEQSASYCSFLSTQSASYCSFPEYTVS